MDEEAAEAGVRREPDIDRFYALDLGIEAAWGERELADVVESPHRLGTIDGRLPDSVRSGAIVGSFLPGR